MRKARKEDIAAAKSWIQSHHHEPFPGSSGSEDDSEGSGDGESTEIPRWSRQELMTKARQRDCLLVIDGYVVDASGYIGEHVWTSFSHIIVILTHSKPGGSIFLRRYAVPSDGKIEDQQWKEASWAFGGGMNMHSRIAKQRMISMRVAKLSD